MCSNCIQWLLSRSPETKMTWVGSGSSIPPTMAGVISPLRSASNEAAGAEQAPQDEFGFDVVESGIQIGFASVEEGRAALLEFCKVFGPGLINAIKCIAATGGDSAAAAPARSASVSRSRVGSKKTSGSSPKSLSWYNWFVGGMAAVGLSFSEASTLYSRYVKGNAYMQGNAPTHADIDSDTDQLSFDFESIESCEDASRSILMWPYFWKLVKGTADEDERPMKQGGKFDCIDIVTSVLENTMTHLAEGEDLPAAASSGSTKSGKKSQHGYTSVQRGFHAIKNDAGHPLHDRIARLIKMTGNSNKALSIFYSALKATKLVPKNASIRLDISEEDYDEVVKPKMMELAA